MIDRGKLDPCCQLAAAALVNWPAQVILDIMISMIDSKVPGR